MKRAGFTMIELIFVIVILGILAAVALPKFIGVSEQAESGKCLAAVGTMNRTVGPALWSDSLMKQGANRGSIINGASPYDSAAAVSVEIFNQFQIPAACLGATATVSTAALIETNWLDGGGTPPLGATLGTFDKGPDILIGSKTFNVYFMDGSSSSTPQWAWANADDTAPIPK